MWYGGAAANDNFGIQWRRALHVTFFPARLAAMAKTPVRIPIPSVKDPSGVLTLGDAVLKKHKADGAASVIRGQLKLDLEAVEDDITEGVKDDAEAKALEKELEKIYERRNNRVARIQPLLPRVSKTLQGEYGQQNLRRMGDHGYTVDDTPRPPKDGAAKS